jgi:hypothetical protein
MPKTPSEHIYRSVREEYEEFLRRSAGADYYREAYQLIESRSLRESPLNVLQAVLDVMDYPTGNHS